MAKFVINGGKKLEGEIRVSGAKNAVFPLLAAALLTKEECEFENVPEITDKNVMVDILKDLGAEIVMEQHRLKVKCEKITKSTPSAKLVSKLRGSVLLLGGLFGRMKKVTLPLPGGDNIGARPLDTHIEVFKAFGAKVKMNSKLELETDKIVGNKIVLEESSVTATENAMLVAAVAEGTTVIKLAAMEPHVQHLGEFLNRMGAKISGLGSTTIIVEGVKTLHGAKITLIPDSEEAASMITLAAATGSHIKISSLNPDYLEDYLMKLKKMKVNFEVGKDYVEVFAPSDAYEATKLQCGLYPKLNSDYLPPMAVLATQAKGESLLSEWMYENRISYVSELNKMGAKAEILDPHRVKITGQSSLKGAKMTSYDLRMGMTLVVAALVANGQSEISDIHHIERGYEDLEKRLKAVGAEIKKVK
jgi:UDP-N-acetylglucosamine 1-carboxyvinyltransferase